MPIWEEKNKPFIELTFAGATQINLIKCKMRDECVKNYGATMRWFDGVEKLVGICVSIDQSLFGILCFVGSFPRNWKKNQVIQQVFKENAQLLIDFPEQFLISVDRWTVAGAA